MDEHGSSSLRLCRYQSPANTKNSSPKEIFGAHTDSSFCTLIPVSDVPGLEVYDETEGVWYRPELRVMEMEKEYHEKDDKESIEKNDDVPFHARFVVVMAGEMLQIVSRNEIAASVHRVVSSKEPRLSCPVLLRGDFEARLDLEAYLGDFADNKLLKDVDGKLVKEIHSALQFATKNK